MQYMKSLWTNLLMVLFIALILVCCKQEERIVIGVSQCSEDIWRDKLIEELLLASYQHDGVTLKILSTRDDDQQQISQIKQLMDEGIDLLIVSPNQLHKITPVINEVYDSGIPVILFDRKTDSQKYTAFIGADNVEAGRIMGEYIASQLDRKGNVAEISGLRTSSPAQDRHKGFMTVMNKYPDIHIVEQRYADWLESTATVEMDSLLKKHPKIDFIFSQNDRMAVGAMSAAQKAGRTGIRYTGIDALPVAGGGLEQVVQGNLAATYIYPTRGDLVLQLAMDILQGKSYKRENYLQGAIVTEDDAHLLLMQNDEMNKQRERLHELHVRVNSYLSQYSHQQVYLVLLLIIVALMVCLIVYVYYFITIKHRLKEDANQSKLRFFTNISHELRTPLALIYGPIRHLGMAKNLTDEQRGILGIVDRNISVLSRLVDQILDFRKIQNEKMELRISEFDLSKVIFEWKEMFVAAIGDAKITFEISVPETLALQADKSKVESMGYNLLSNALKYTPPGGTVFLNAQTDGEYIKLVVSNTGKGIEASDMPYVFDRFYQTGNCTGGTGIGLALVKAFAELHRGTVEVESVVDEFTSFTIRLPQKSPLYDAQKAVENPEMADNDDSAILEVPQKLLPDNAFNTGSHPKDIHTLADGSQEKLRLLIIDDNADMRSYISILTSGQYEVSMVNNGADGLNIARQEMPDVIICDVMMPVMDGLEFTRKLKEEPLICHIPVLLLTAKVMPQHRAEGYQQGADAYLIKPFNTEVLLSRLENLVRNRRLIKNIFSSTATPLREKETPKSPEDIFAEHFRDVIDKNLSNNDCNMDFLASEIGLSRTQLYRKIKAITGKSPNDILREARLQRADHLLKTTHKSTSEIAYEVGFSSPSYFSKCYKEAFGHTPSDK